MTTKTPKSTVLNFEGMFSQYVAEHQKVWEHDRGSTVGASEVFGCQRKSFFDKFVEKFGFKEDPDYEHEHGWGAMERGNVMEEHWVVPVLEAMIPKTSKYLFGTAGQETFVYGQNSATPDGLITNLASDALIDYGIEDIESDCILVEVKSFDPRSSFDEEKEIHHGQAQQQMGIIRRMTQYRPMYTVILYVNASFYDDIKAFPVRYDPGSWKAAVRRADEVLNAETASDLRPEGKMTDGCKFCKWTHECAKASKELVPTDENVKDDIDPEIAIELENLVRDERKAAQQEKDSKADKESLRADIKDLLLELQKRKVKQPKYSISWTFQEGKKTVDTKAMREAGIDLEPFTTEGAGFEKMTIKFNED